jgi:DNA-directed RNA polymerase alpha subunit
VSRLVEGENFVNMGSMVGVEENFLLVVQTVGQQSLTEVKILI